MGRWRILEKSIFLNYNSSNSPDKYGKNNSREHRKRTRTGYTVDEKLNIDQAVPASPAHGKKGVHVGSGRYEINHPTLLPNGKFPHEAGYVKCSNQAFRVTRSGVLPRSLYPALEPSDIELLAARCTVRTVLDGLPFQSKDDRVIALAAMMEPMLYLHFDAADTQTYLMVGNMKYAEKLKQTIGAMYPTEYGQRLVVGSTLPEHPGSDVHCILFREDADMTSQVVPVEVNADDILAALATLVSHWSSEGRPLGDSSILGAGQYARTIDGVLRSTELINPKKLKS